ncbi:pyruvate decarboxylase [Amniculicola lignicola CBS 123094]|uniref:Pyruvate decarboxylase n=1 Tax=Amniculicola lignicola CBS 123094 TaxID=1392246 RepID=A0A6A5WIH0_9PLEO|nr:pyruvate decarboxylase [Amniculicola lignicola CBS 123094]
MATISLGRYMWERIRQVGVETIFGVPGDFNLQFLDSIFEVDGLKWIGNQNELNAAYAADGYARIKGVPGVFVTTHGVGELSALNGVAGAMSEHVKLIHVVGQTTRLMQDKHMMIHHSIGREPNHQQYNNASKGLRYAAAELWDIKTAPQEIDRVIRECFIQSGPVYIFMPLDLSAEQVSTDLLKTPIDFSPKVDTVAQGKAVEAILAALSSSKNPSVFIDALAHRFNAVSESRELVKKLHIPFYSSNMGKGVVDETEEMYVGNWNGPISSPGVDEAAQQSDLVITFGYLPADTNSGGFARKLESDKSVIVNPFNVVVKGTIYPDTSLKPLLSALIKSLPSHPQQKVSKPILPPPRTPLDIAATNITQSYLWPRISEFLTPGDILLADTGTTVFGLCDIPFPENVRFTTQIYYGSIGWATPATLGVDVARKEISNEGRTILITGDGSLALTIQEIGTMIKQKSSAIIFVINNEGYTVERMIWGAQQPYNDIVPTTYSHLLPLYQHPTPSTSYHLATTKVELDSLLSSPALLNPPNLQLVEIVVPKLDTSWRLAGQLAYRGEAAKEYLNNEGFVNTYGDWGLGAVEGGEGKTGVKWT